MNKVSIRYCKVWASYRPKAVSSAAVIKNEFGIEPELIEGSRGEFTVWVGERQVAQKGWIMFPSDEKIVAAVRQALTK